MMIDHVVFFITLNPISACCKLSNDGSLLAIAQFKGFCSSAQHWPFWDGIKGSIKNPLFACTKTAWEAHFNSEVQNKLPLM